jgi:hypothetical protein
VTIAVAGGGHVTWCYVTDPEDNVIERKPGQSRDGVGVANSYDLAP